MQHDVPTSAGMPPSPGAETSTTATPASRAPETVEITKPDSAKFGWPWGSPRTLVVLGILAVLLGVVGRLVWAAATAEEPDRGEVVAQIPFDPNGTEAAFDQGAGTVSVPPGAVSKRETVTIYKKPIEDRVRAVSRGGEEADEYPPGTLVTYMFTPTTLQLNRPITVTLAIPAGKDGLVFVSENGQVRVLPGLGSGREVKLVVNTFDFTRTGAIRVSDKD